MHLGPAYRSTVKLGLALTLSKENKTKAEQPAENQLGQTGKLREVHACAGKLQHVLTL